MVRVGNVVMGSIFMGTGGYWILFNRPIAIRAVDSQQALQIPASRRKVLVNRLICGLGGLVFMAPGVMAVVGTLNLL